MQFKQSQLAILAFSAIAKAHFVLQTPFSLGFDDEQEGVAPCGSFDPTDRSVAVTEWPIAGAPVGVISTHLDVEWEYNAALISDVTNFVPLTLHLHQTGVGSFCEAQIPGNPDVSEFKELLVISVILWAIVFMSKLTENSTVGWTGCCASGNPAWPRWNSVSG